MTIQHIAIPDAKRHEAKGASTASNGQVLKANGSDTTSFVDPSTLNNVLLVDAFSAVDLTTQNPSAVDVPLQVTFGAAGSNSYVSLSSGGTITFSTAGVYQVAFNLNFTRGSTAGLSKIAYRILLNDAQFDTVGYVIMNDDGVSVPIQYTFTKAFAATNTLKVQILRDSTGVNTGGLAPFDPVLAGWGNAVSASVKVQKLTGVA